jgi:hypothetical protein
MMTDAPSPLTDRTSDMLAELRVDLAARSGPEAMVLWALLRILETLARLIAAFRAGRLAPLEPRVAVARTAAAPVEAAAGTLEARLPTPRIRRARKQLPLTLPLPRVKPGGGPLVGPLRGPTPQGERERVPHRTREARLRERRRDVAMTAWIAREEGPDPKSQFLDTRLSRAYFVTFPKRILTGRIRPSFSERSSARRRPWWRRACRP